MNLDDAVKAHVAWKIKFRSAIVARTAIDVATISRDDCCELGQWLKGEARVRYGQLPAYAQCANAHSVFHREAGRVAALNNKSDLAGAEAAIGSSTPFSNASTNAVSAITRLKHAVAA